MLIDPCIVATLSIKPQILTAVDLIYNITDPAHRETLLDVEVASNETTATCCPDIVFEVVTIGGEAIDRNVFTYTASAQTFDTYSLDLSLHGNVYNMRIRAKYDGSIYTNVGTLDFSVELID